MTKSNRLCCIDNKSIVKRKTPFRLKATMHYWMFIKKPSSYAMKYELIYLEKDRIIAFFTMKNPNTIVFRLVEIRGTNP